MEATIGALHYIKEMGLSGLPSKDGLVLSQRDVLAFMNETRHAYGRTALHLSGGAALGVHHLGVLKAMLELRMLPRVLSGTSAGSIIAAIAGVRTHAELEALLFSEGGELAAIVTARKFFEPMQNAHDGGAQGGGAEEGPLDKGAGGAGEGAQPAQPGAWARLMRLLHSLLAPRGPVLNVDTLGETIRELVGDCTFLQAFNATGRILKCAKRVRPLGRNEWAGGGARGARCAFRHAPASQPPPPPPLHFPPSTRSIMVSRTDGREPMLLNYLTAPHVLVWSACRASSAVPGIFAPCELWARGPSGQSVPLDELKFTDGCVDSDLPKARLTELFNINVRAARPRRPRPGPRRRPRASPHPPPMTRASPLSATRPAPQSAQFFIVSQVNPAATLLSTKAVNESGIATGGLTALLLRMLRAEVSAYIRTASELSVGSLPFKTTLSRIFNVVVQEYDGDLNLYPAYPMSDLLHMIDNPTAEYLGIATLRGQRAVWTRASQLRSLCRIEFEMDAICHELQSSLAPSRPESLAASRRPSMEHNSSAAAQPPANGALGLRRCGQIPSFNTLDMAAGGGAHQPPPPANAAAQAARKLLSRGRFSSTPLGLRSSAGNLNDLPPITSVASYLSLAQASDFVAPEEAGGAEPRQLIEAHRAPSFSDDARADEALLRALP